MNTTSLLDKSTVKNLEIQKNDLLAQVATIDQILSAALGGGSNNKKTSPRINLTPNRAPHGSSSRFIPTIMGMKGEFTVAQVAEKALGKEDTKENRVGIHNVIASLVRNGKVKVVKAGLGRSVAIYQVIPESGKQPEGKE